MKKLPYYKRTGLNNPLLAGSKWTLDKLQAEGIVYIDITNKGDQFISMSLLLLYD